MFSVCFISVLVIFVSYACETDVGVFGTCVVVCSVYVLCVCVVLV